MSFSSIFFLFLFLGCKEAQVPKLNISIVSAVSTTPNWYENRDIHKESFEIIGYGFGKDQNEAKENARKDIVEQISINIQSENIKIEKRVGKKFETSFSNISTQKIYLTLSNLEIIKISKNRKFFALKYSNLPFETKFLKKIGKYSCGFQNSFLKNTKFGKLAIQENSCLPKISVFQNGNSLFLNSGDISELFSLSNLFFDKTDSQIVLDIPKFIKEREEFDIQFSTYKKGFVNILLITDKGEVFEVLSNHFSENIEKTSVGRILNKKFFGIVENGKNSEKSMFIAIFSEQSLEDSFLKIRDENQKYQEINFSKFLELFQDSRFHFSGKIVTII